MTTAAQIALLVNSCPVSCMDVTPVCNPPSPPIPSPPPSPSPAPLTPGSASSVVPAPPPPYVCADDPTYFDLCTPAAAGR